MLFIRHVNDMSDSERGAVIALGNFDGFHRGHQVVVGEAGRIARNEGRPLALFTTEPHPRSYFAPESKPYRLTPFRERAWLFEHFGVEILFVLTFDAELAGTTATEFVQNVLARDLGVSHIVVGQDYQFGKGRQGTAATLQELAADHGMDVTVIEPVGLKTGGTAANHVSPAHVSPAHVSPAQFSSTMVRQCLESGNVLEAARILGHWWGLNGHVIEGEKRGRQIGFPTANLSFGDSLLPALGVYAVRVCFDDDDARVYDGVANIGTRPTFDGEGVLLEAHIFDFNEDLYNRHTRVELVDHIRDEKKFDGLDALKAQIVADCTKAKEILRDPARARALYPFPTLEAYLADNPG